MLSPVQISNTANSPFRSRSLCLMSLLQTAMFQHSLVTTDNRILGLLWLFNRGGAFSVYAILIQQQILLEKSLAKFQKSGHQSEEMFVCVTRLNSCLLRTRTFCVTPLPSASIINRPQASTVYFITLYLQRTTSYSVHLSFALLLRRHSSSSRLKPDSKQTEVASSSRKSLLTNFSLEEQSVYHHLRLLHHATLYRELHHG